MNIKEQKTVTQKIVCQNVYELFQAVYEIASYSVVSVYIDVENLTATIVLEVKG